jgi:phosphatidate cytidylyltransferase
VTNLQLRIISAAVLGAAVLLLAWWGGAPFRILCAVGCVAIAYEWGRMRAVSETELGSQTPLLVGAAVFGALLIFDVPASALLAAIAAITALLAAAAARSDRGARWEVSGFLYAALSAMSVALVRGDDANGLVAILFLFAVVWATDILAYFVGRRIGGPKLAPAISPGKTQSGAVGGIVGGLVAGVAVAVLAGVAGWIWLALVAVVLSIVSQAGDLLESWIKRRHGVKDSGTLIPGHGGVMDRVDGLVAAALALYLLGWMMGGADDPAAVLFAR